MGNRVGKTLPQCRPQLCRSASVFYNDHKSGFQAPFQKRGKAYAGAFRKEVSRVIRALIILVWQRRLRSDKLRLSVTHLLED